MNQVEIETTAEYVAIWVGFGCAILGAAFSVYGHLAVVEQADAIARLFNNGWTIFTVGALVSMSYRYRAALRNSQ